MKAKARRLRIFFYKSPLISPSTAVEEHERLIEAIEQGSLEDSKTNLEQHWDHVIQEIRSAAERY